MTAQQLYSYRACRLEVERLSEQLEKLKTIYFPKAQNMTGMPRGSADSDQALIAFVEQKSKLEQMIRERMINLIVQQSEVEKAIESLEDAIDRNILRLRYIDGISFEEIANIVGYEERQVYRRKKKAISQLCS